jgi:hypothetical protein
MSVGREVACAWAQILDRLKELDKMENYMKIAKAKNWMPSSSGGPRRLVHPGEPPY